MEPDVIPSYITQYSCGDGQEDEVLSLSSNLIRMKITDQVKELQTVLRDR